MLVRRSTTLFLCGHRFTGLLSQQHGHPILTLTLPSRNQPVAFTCKPVTGTVGSLITDIVREDGGVTGCDILTESGEKLSRATSLSRLLRLERFQVAYNGKTQLIRVPQSVSAKAYQPSLPSDNGVNETRWDVSRLYTALNIKSHQFTKEQELVEKREELLKELEPFYRLNSKLRMKSERSTLMVQYGILAYMVGMWGILFRLTWWEYSWDIMEPVTYFITFAHTVALYMYYMKTKTEPEYDQVEQRYKLHYLHKYANKDEFRFDISDYNDKQRRLRQINQQLQRLRDPLRLELPIRQERNNSTGDLY